MGGGILNNGGHVSLSRVHFVGNEARGDSVIGAGGGAIANVFGASLVADHCTFVGNSVRDGFSVAGGAIENDADAEVVLLNSSFDSNKSIGPFATGGAISSNNGSILQISGCSFTSNLAKATSAFAALGGAVDVEDIGFFDVTPTFATIESSSFSGNQALGGVGSEGEIGGQGAGGALYLTGEGTEVSIIGCNFVGNLASAGRGGSGGGDGALGFGGAACNSGASLRVAASSFLDNKVRGGAGAGGSPSSDGGAGGAGLGGAIAASTSIGVTIVSTEIEACIFVGNAAFGGAGGAGGIGGDGGLGGNGGGGAVFNLVGTMSIFGSVISANQAVAGQGGLAGPGGVGGNGGLGAGGGVFNGFLGLGGTTEILYCTIAGNAAVGGAPGAGGGVGGDGLGGGVYNGGGGAMTIAYSQIDFNKARGGRGGKGLMGGVYNDSLLILIATDIFANVDGILALR
jgi:hypothetical protein